MTERTKHIYVVDDEPGILEALQMVLEDEGYTVTASNNATAISMLTQNRASTPDLILLDVFLEGSNGIELAHALRQNPLTAGIPIILMSAQPKQIREDAVRVADLFLSKPFDVTVLLREIERLLPISVGA